MTNTTKTENLVLVTLTNETASGIAIDAEITVKVEGKKAIVWESRAAYYTGTTRQAPADVLTAARKIAIKAAKAAA